MITINVGFGESIGCEEIDIGLSIGSQEDEHDDL